MSIRWTIVKDKLISDNTHISWKEFEFLTGKHINWNIRIDKDIVTIKDRGHIRIYDANFIVSEIYKHRSGIYICSVIDKDNIALLNKTGPGNLTIRSANDPIRDSWEIA